MYYLTGNCPFCDSMGARVYAAEKKWYQHLIPDFKERYYCKCNRCKCMLGPFISVEEAIKSWEYRPKKEVKIEKPKNRFEVPDSRPHRPSISDMYYNELNRREAAQKEWVLQREWAMFNTAPMPPPTAVVDEDGILQLRSK